MDPLVDPRCLETTDAVVVDGAHAICHGARMDAGDPLGSGALGVAVLAVLLTAWLWRPRGLLLARRVVLAALFVAAALPGLGALTFVRADRPRHLRRASRDVAALHDAVREFAVAHHGAHVERTECTACAPIVELALAGLPDVPGAPIELRGDALASGCAEEDGRLVCGVVSFSDLSRTGAR